ncbi:MAG TPA: HD domain-containing protein [Longimicrobium sp.]|nr:HD domain-containing protein [Longimicrobium sp.]
MSLLAARKDRGVAPLATRIDDWAEKVLRPYLRKYPQNPYQSSKIFQDLVWGPIEVRPGELYILDSPIGQRLRYVAQLGVAHFLYPTIGYSRFEHSLGALHQLDRMLRSLQATKRCPAQLEQLPYIYCLRLAALLHDIGHCAFSHVSEKFYQFHPDIVYTRNCFAKLYRRRPSASEVLSLLIISSEVLRELIDVPATDKGERPLSREAGIELIGAVIAGSNSDAWPPFLTQMVNGGVDCDKLDYLARDAKTAGTPAMLDVGRLLSKLRVARTTAGGAEVESLAIDVTGIRALEELLATRVFLFDKIYFHHKLLAAEELLRRALTTLAKVFPNVTDPVFLLNYPDEDFLRFRLPITAADGFDPETTHHLSEAEHLFRRVANRDLPRRQFAFAQRFWLKPPEIIRTIATSLGLKDDRANQVIVRRLLTTSTGKEEEREALRVRIGELAAELGHPTGVYVTWPDPERVSYKLEIPAVDADGGVTQVDQLFSSSMWVEAYGVNKQTGYVFADTPAPAVYLAAERAFAERTLTWDSRCWKLAKVSNTAVEEFRADLPQVLGWVQHRLAPDYLISPDAARRIATVETKLGQFLTTRGIETVQWIRAWLWQFPDPDLQESALRVLEQFKVINRADRSRAFEIFNKATGAKLWCELAGQRKKTSSSSARIGYEAKDLGPDAPEIVKLWDVDLDRLREQGTVVFFDDILCSGTQSSSLLYSWFDMPDRASAPGDVDKPLPAKLQQLIRQLGVTFFYPFGWVGGVELLRNTCEELGIPVKFHLCELAGEQHTIDSVEFACEESRNRILLYLAERGIALLSTKQPDWKDDQKQLFALGYGGIRAIVASDHSIPTCTLTAIWQGSYESDNLWLPLLPRDQGVYARFWGRVEEGLAQKAARVPEP